MRTNSRPTSARRSALSRPLDPRYPTNVAIVAAAVAAGLTAGLGAAAGLLEAASGFRSMAAVFAAWALGREIDPDHDLSAFLSAGLAFAASLALGPLSLLGLGTLLLALRLVNRVVGVQPALYDSVVVMAAALLGIFFDTWVIGVIGAAAFALDGLLSQPHRPHLIAAALSGAAAGVHLALEGAGSPGALTLPYITAALAITASFFVTVAATRRTTTCCDLTGEPLNLARLRAAMAVALLAGLAFLRQGDAGFVAMAPLWAALLGTTLYRALPAARRVTNPPPPAAG